MSRITPSCLSVKLPIMEKPTSSELAPSRLGFSNEFPSSELTPTRLGFPNEFPYEFESPAFSPGFTSPGDSTETEDESSDDEEDFLAGLTRRLAPSTHRLPPTTFNTKIEEKRQLGGTSPQSTLSGLGSFSNSGTHSPIFPSPQEPKTSSFRRDNAYDVISAAAGEVARLKLGSYESHSHLPIQNPNLLLRRQNAAFHSLQQQRRLYESWLCSKSDTLLPKRVMNHQDVAAFEKLRFMRHNALSNATWQQPPQLAGASLKRPSVGTGVFLPRRYPTSDSFKKPETVNGTAMLQSKVKLQNLNFNEFTTSGPRQFDYECMFGRSTSVARQGSLRSVNCLNEERCLPQDWMY